jgi:hypothetical protein
MSPAKQSEQPSQNARAKRAQSRSRTPMKAQQSTKSTKQSNIADWIGNSATSKKGLVGQKRGNQDAEPNRSNKHRKEEDVSEFRTGEE